MLFIMTWYILRHVGIFFATHPVWATICTIAYITGGVASARLHSKGKDYNTRKTAENVFTFVYVIPIFLVLLIVAMDILFIPFYIRAEATYDDALGYFALAGGIFVVIFFVWGYIASDYDPPELGAP